VQILAVGNTQLLSPGEAATKDGTAAAGTGSSGLITFNVPAKAAQYLASFEEKGFYLSLVPKDYQPEKIDPLPPTIDRLPGEDPAQLCPYFDTAKDTGCAAKVGS